MEKLCILMGMCMLSSSYQYVETRTDRIRYDVAKSCCDLLYNLHGSIFHIRRRTDIELPLTKTTPPGLELNDIADDIRSMPSLQYDHSICGCFTSCFQAQGDHSNSRRKGCKSVLRNRRHRLLCILQLQREKHSQHPITDMLVPHCLELLLHGNPVIHRFNIDTRDTYRFKESESVSPKKHDDLYATIKYNRKKRIESPMSSVGQKAQRSIFRRSPSDNINCSPHCKNQCRLINGTCESCFPGFRGYFCNETCSTGFYGLGCTQKCPRSCLDDQCNHISGHCVNCQAGYIGNNCTTQCVTGYYGEQCSKRCSEMCEDNICDFRSGDCRSCLPGYFGSACDKLCPPETYGRNCTLKCSKTCQSECNRITGECLKCASGYTGLLCNDKCAAGSYGIGCSLSCPDECLNNSCNHVDGKCIQCKPSLEGDFCKEPVSLERMENASVTEIRNNVTHGSNNGGELYPAVIIFLATLGIIIFSTAIYFLRAYYKRKSGNKNCREPEVTSSPRPMVSFNTRYSDSSSTSDDESGPRKSAPIFLHENANGSISCDSEKNPLGSRIFLMFQDNSQEDQVASSVSASPFPSSISSLPSPKVDNGNPQVSKDSASGGFAYSRTDASSAISTATCSCRESTPVPIHPRFDWTKLVNQTEVNIDNDGTISIHSDSSCSTHHDSSKGANPRTVQYQHLEEERDAKITIEGGSVAGSLISSQKILVSHSPGTSSSASHSTTFNAVMSKTQSGQSAAFDIQFNQSETVDSAKAPLFGSDQQKDVESQPELFSTKVTCKEISSSQRRNGVETSDSVTLTVHQSSCPTTKEHILSSRNDKPMASTHPDEINMEQQPSTQNSTDHVSSKEFTSIEVDRASKFSSLPTSSDTATKAFDPLTSHLSALKLLDSHLQVSTSNERDTKTHSSSLPFLKTSETVSMPATSLSSVQTVNVNQRSVNEEASWQHTHEESEAVSETTKSKSFVSLGNNSQSSSHHIHAGSEAIPVVYKSPSGIHSVKDNQSLDNTKTSSQQTQSVSGSEPETYRALSYVHLANDSKNFATSETSSQQTQTHSMSESVPVTSSRSIEEDMTLRFSDLPTSSDAATKAFDPINSHLSILKLLDLQLQVSTSNEGDTEVNSSSLTNGSPSHVNSGNDSKNVAIPEISLNQTQTHSVSESIPLTYSGPPHTVHSVKDSKSPYTCETFVQQTHTGSNSVAETHIHPSTTRSEKDNKSVDTVETPSQQKLSVIKAISVTYESLPYFHSTKDTKSFNTSEMSSQQSFASVGVHEQKPESLEQLNGSMSNESQSFVHSENDSHVRIIAESSSQHTHKVSELFNAPNKPSSSVDLGNGTQERFRADTSSQQTCMLSKDERQKADVCGKMPSSVSDKWSSTVHSGNSSEVRVTAETSSKQTHAMEDEYEEIKDASNVSSCLLCNLLKADSANYSSLQGEVKGAQHDHASQLWSQREYSNGLEGSEPVLHPFSDARKDYLAPNSSHLDSSTLIQFSGTNIPDNIPKQTEYSKLNTLNPPENKLSRHPQKESAGINILPRCYPDLEKRNASMANNEQEKTIDLRMPLKGNQGVREEGLSTNDSPPSPQTRQLIANTGIVRNKENFHHINDPSISFRNYDFNVKGVSSSYDSSNESQSGPETSSNVSTLKLTQTVAKHDSWKKIGFGKCCGANMDVSLVVFPDKEIKDTSNPTRLLRSVPFIDLKPSSSNDQGLSRNYTPYLPTPGKTREQNGSKDGPSISFADSPININTVNQINDSGISPPTTHHVSRSPPPAPIPNHVLKSFRYDSNPVVTLPPTPPSSRTKSRDKASTLIKNGCTNSGGKGRHYQKTAVHSKYETHAVGFSTGKAIRDQKASITPSLCRLDADASRFPSTTNFSLRSGSSESQQESEAELARQCSSSYLADQKPSLTHLASDRSRPQRPAHLDFSRQSAGHDRVIRCPITRQVSPQVRNPPNDETGRHHMAGIDSSSTQPESPHRSTPK